MACCGLPLANAACPVLECSGKQDRRPLPADRKVPGEESPGPVEATPRKVQQKCTAGIFPVRLEGQCKRLPPAR